MDSSYLYCLLCKEYVDMEREDPFDHIEIGDSM